MDRNTRPRHNFWMEQVFDPEEIANIGPRSLVFATAVDLWLSRSSCTILTISRQWFVEMSAARCGALDHGLIFPLKLPWFSFQLSRLQVCPRQKLCAFYHHRHEKRPPPQDRWMDHLMGHVEDGMKQNESGGRHGKGFCSMKSIFRPWVTMPPWQRMKWITLCLCPPRICRTSGLQKPDAEVFVYGGCVSHSIGKYNRFGTTATQRNCMMFVLSREFWESEDFLSPPFMPETTKQKDMTKPERAQTDPWLHTNKSKFRLKRL